MFMMKSKQQGFTLLELLVVITLLAVLAVGALVAYEDVGDNAEAAAAANANVTLDSAIRTYRAVEKKYPNQWDVLATTAGSAISTLPNPASAIFGALSLANTTVYTGVSNALLAAGIDELQYMTADLPAGVNPNRAHNESVNPTAVERDVADPLEVPFISIVPSGGALGTCVVGGTTVSLNTVFNGTPLATVPTLGANTVQNKFNDSMEADECHLVVALGFGSDAAASTTSSKVAISQAPTYTKTDAANPQNSVNPARHYARYIGLFHVAGSNDPGTETEGFFDKARLVAVITPDGKVIDDAIAAAQTNNN